MLEQRHGAMRLLRPLLSRLDDPKLLLGHECGDRRLVVTIQLKANAK
jgi:hypothetical protein